MSGSEQPLAEGWLTWGKDAFLALGAMVVALVAGIGMWLRAQVELLHKRVSTSGTGLANHEARISVLEDRRRYTDATLEELRSDVKTILNRVTTLCARSGNNGNG